MIKDNETREELKRISAELYAIGSRIKDLSTKIALKENSKDGDEIFNVGSYVGSQVLTIAQTAGFSMTVDGDKMTFEDWNDDDI